MLRNLFLGTLLTFLTLPAFAGSPAPAPTAASSIASTIVEFFTSKNCPSCPAAERYLEGWLRDAPTQPLVIYSHVDYWDEKALKPDPLSLAEATQRQYDYSNTLGRRPGEVFTPQPIINGRTMVKPSLRFNWPSAIAEELATPLPPLTVTASGTSYTVTLPVGASIAGNTLWLLGLTRDATHPVYHLRGLAEKELTGADRTITLAPEVLPAGTHVLVLLQKLGPGPILASALIER